MHVSFYMHEYVYQGVHSKTRWTLGSQ